MENDPQTILLSFANAGSKTFDGTSATLPSECKRPLLIFSEVDDILPCPVVVLGGKNHPRRPI